MRYVDSACGAHRAPVTEAATTFAPAASAPVTRSAWRLERSNPSSALEKKERTSKASRQTGRLFAESLVMRGSFFDTQTALFGFYSTSRHCIPRLSPRNSNPAKRLTMALQRTAPRVTVAAILIRASLVRATFFRSSYAFSSFHPRSYRAALRSL